MASLKNETTNLILTSSTGAAFFASGALMLNQLADTDFSVSAAATTGLTISLAYHWLRHIGTIKLYRNRRMANLARSTTWYQQPREIKWYDRRESHPPEFIFSNFGLSRAIPETLLLRFSKIACRRQELVFTPTARKPNGLRMKSTEPLSEIYFTKTLRPRFLPEDYFAIRYILQLTGIWLNASVGNPGLLYLDTYTPTPERVGRIARWRWLEMTEKENNPTPPMAIVNVIKNLDILSSS